jgi:hypothetical protein
MVNSCGPQPQQYKIEGDKLTLISKIDKSSPIEDVELVHTHAIVSSNSICINFVRFKYNGHYYISNGKEIMFHSPDCICQDSNNGSSLLTTPIGSSSSLFNW